MKPFYLLAAALLLADMTFAFAAPVPKPKPKKEVGPVEIDFSPIPGLRGDVAYRLELSIEFENVQGTTKAAYKIGAGASPCGIGNLIKTSLPTVEIEQVGVNFEKLIIKEYDGHRVTKVDIKVEGIPKEHTPTLRRLPEKKK